ncbi:flagellin [Neiella marina]|uniref:Flagellin n=1 Tax=Neiella holothuriorum TaxID=2870530 RepID=A0ABS7EEX6_9GAMM|nr:flagellin [Neiella holothuriorum]MBW8190815.1 flagellin [Neiella holothuriorum]
MALSVQTNVSAINSTRNLNAASDGVNTSLTRLSSGLRINSAADDAAGLQISNRLTSQINGLNVAVRNANDGISISQTAEGALQESTDILQRMRDLSIQSANGSNGSSDRVAIQEEISQLQKELTRIAETTSFGDRNLLDGSFGSESFQVGAQANETIDVTLAAFGSADMGSYQQQLTSADSTAAASTGLGAIATPAAATDPADNGVTAGTITITSSGETAEATIADNDSAAEVADAINAASGLTGVDADARTKIEVTGFSGVAGDSISFDLTGSNTDAETIIAVVGSDGGIQSLANEINKVSGNTGITASVTDAGDLELVSENGDDIAIRDYTGDTALTVQNYEYDGSTDAGGTASLAANGSIVASGTVQLNGASSYTVDTDTTNILAGSADANSDLGTAVASNTSALNSVAEIDVSSAKGAQDALAVIDGALSYIDSSRAQLGAVQNRLSSTISNLENIVENSSASRSRIRDTDFATETTELTKNQILQQASTSILAQAQQLPQAALSLLG